MVLENEKIQFATYVYDHLHGKILNDPSPPFEYFNYVKASKLDIVKKITPTYKQDADTFLNSLEYNVTTLYINGTSMSEIISHGHNYDLKYVVSSKSGSVFYPFLDEIYDNEKKFPYLHKIFDSNESGFSKLKVKVFEIDYQQFYSKND